MAHRPQKPDRGIVVFIVARDRGCAGCGAELPNGSHLALEDDAPLCLVCAGLDHLEFLPSGDAALTRRATKLATHRAVVVKWSAARKRYERQGILVDPDAIGLAIAQCEADSKKRERQRDVAASRRDDEDRRYFEAFAQAVRARFPRAPAGVELLIAEHSCRKYSKRVGRSAAAKTLDGHAVFLAVRAHVRHTRTRYDELLAAHYDRTQARETVGDRVRAILEAWSAPE